MKSKLDYDQEGFALAKDHLLLRLKSEGGYTAVLKDGSWFVTGQLLVMEAGELDFVPRRKTVNRAVV